MSGDVTDLEAWRGARELSTIRNDRTAEEMHVAVPANIAEEIARQIGKDCDAGLITQADHDRWLSAMVDVETPSQRATRLHPSNRRPQGPA